MLCEYKPFSPDNVFTLNKYKGEILAQYQCKQEKIAYKKGENGTNLIK